MLLDERDPEFRRYVVEATDEILCAKGPAEGADTILVLPGELFTVNDYSALPLERYFGWEVIAIADKKRKLAASVKPDAKDYQKRSRDLWDWRVKVPPELKALLKSQRDESAKMLADRRAEARAKALQAMADSSATNNF